jgi:sugar/nucleoside kinase (ribokinase family)
MKDVALYGHLTIDTIVDGDSERKTLGSMANVWKVLLELDPTLDIGLSPIDVGQALIYVDKPAAKRYSKVNLSLIQHKAKIYDSKIHHLIYLNEMTRHDFIPAIDGIITADICPGKSVNKDLLSVVDYLFISDEDIDGDLSEYAEVTKGWVILHGASGSVVSNGEKEFFYKLPEELMLKDVNVLGAGDTFASCFLYKLLQNEGDIHNWIEFAHLKTTEIIRNSI